MAKSELPINGRFYLGFFVGDGVFQRQHIKASALIGRDGPNGSGNARLSRKPYLPQQGFVLGPHHRDGRLVVAPLNVAGRVPAACTSAPRLRKA